MEYLRRVLGIKTEYLDDVQSVLPNFIFSRYRIQKVLLDGKIAFFVYPQTELESISSVQKHIETIERTLGSPAILVPAQLTHRQKEYLLRDRISFIVEGKQIYLPFMAVYLQERGDSEIRETAKMLPSAQLLLLYYIYHGCGELMTSEASVRLALTATSISRASRQLEGMGLIKTEKRGVQKVIYTKQSPEELFYAAKANMENPVKRTIYVPKAAINKELLMSGYAALSEYTMLNPPAVKSFAVDSVSAWEEESSSRLQSSYDQYEIELWRYDPRKLAVDYCVDRLSLALALRDDRDERVEEAVEEMLRRVWRDIDGQRT